MSSEQVKGNSLIYLGRDYIAGSIGGITQVLIGQPFDTIKVRIQSSATKLAVTDCVKDLIQHEGIFAFYKGVASPLTCMSAIVSLQFGIFQNAMRKLKEFQGIKDLPLYQIALCGCLSGFGCSGIVAPMEHIRIKMQVMKNNVYKNTFECGLGVYKQFGIRGLFKGMNSTILREVPGEGLYFLSYEFQMRHLRKQFNENPTLLKYSPMLAGGVAGLIFWMFFYPVDTLKSRLQGDSLVNPKYKNFIDAYSQTVKNEGAQSLYKGVKVCAVRSIPVNAFGFLAFEETKKLIEEHYSILHH